MQDNITAEMIKILQKYGLHARSCDIDYQRTSIEFSSYRTCVPSYAAMNAMSLMTMEISFDTGAFENFLKVLQHELNRNNLHIKYPVLEKNYKEYLMMEKLYTDKGCE